MTSSENALIEFLRTPAAYPHGPDDVTEIQTHISWVFVAPPYVYKVKKPVSLGFLDFSTLEKRRHYCEEEIRLNARLCPDVYNRVVPISERNGTFSLDDDCHVVEYAVKMKKLSGGFFADELARTDELSRDDVDRILETLCDFYARESPSAKTAAWGRVERLRLSTDENFEQTAAYAGSLLSVPAFDAVRYYTDRFFDQHARLLNERRAGGRILDCHGDLRLEHVYVTPEKICIYDCIEFNDRFRFIDVANDLAFLAMDLDAHGRHELSRYFRAASSRALDDPKLSVVLDFYACYRAFVRAKVESIRSEEEEVPPEEREKSRELARRFYALALRYAVSGSSPPAIVVMGRIGTGKSTIAQHLADALGWDVLSSDLLRKRHAAVALYERGTEQERRRLYSRERTTETYRALQSRAVEILAQGEGVVLDATYGGRARRDALRAELARHGFPHRLIELTASDDVVRERLRKRDDGRRVVSDARLEDFEMLNRGYQPPDDLEDAYHVRVPAEGPVDDTLSRALTELIRLAHAEPSHRLS